MVPEHTTKSRYDLHMPLWRLAHPDDDDSIVSMCLELYSHAPPPDGVGVTQVRATLATFRSEPVRGRALLLDDDGKPGGYAFLVSFWSNELGGEVCTIDELYIVPHLRSQGYASGLVESLRSDGALWPDRPVALELEVSPLNARARMLYERLGFRDRRNATMRLLIKSQGTGCK
jgi:GNAT superfamily N-acetyltransferase